MKVLTQYWQIQEGSPSNWPPLLLIALMPSLRNPSIVFFFFLSIWWGKGGRFYFSFNPPPSYLLCSSICQGYPVPSMERWLLSLCKGAYRCSGRTLGSWDKPPPWAWLGWIFPAAFSFSIWLFNEYIIQAKRFKDSVSQGQTWGGTRRGSGGKGACRTSPTPLVRAPELVWWKENGFWKLSSNPHMCTASRHSYACSHMCAGTHKRNKEVNEWINVEENV